MTVKIWSDVMCPFCYIGKRRFEQALALFPGRDSVSVEWKSFQLDPDGKTIPERSVNEYLAERKGWSLDYTRRVQAQVTAMAKDVGLTYDFDKAVVANSFDAHRLSHLAKQYGKQDAMEERLFRAYFTEGKNTADHDILIALGVEIGLDAAEVATMLSGGGFGDAVQRDIREAREIGVHGVPFFVFDDTYAVSGAQPAELFLQVLTKVSVP